MNPSIGNKCSQCSVQYEAMAKIGNNAMSSLMPILTSQTDQAILLIHYITTSHTSRKRLIRPTHTSIYPQITSVAKLSEAAPMDGYIAIMAVAQAQVINKWKQKMSLAAISAFDGSNFLASGTSIILCQVIILTCQTAKTRGFGTSAIDSAQYGSPSTVGSSQPRSYARSGRIAHASARYTGLTAGTATASEQHSTIWRPLIV